MSASPKDLALLQRRAFQFLVHSFLYYRLDESVLGDQGFDTISKDLRRLRKANPKAEIPHARLVDSALGPEDSAFAIRDYPADVITAAFKLLYGSTRQDVGFVEFVERRGYRAQLAHTTTPDSANSANSKRQSKRQDKR